MPDKNHYPVEPFKLEIPGKQDASSTLNFHPGFNGPGTSEVDASWGGDMVMNVHGSVKWIDKPFVVHSPFDVSGDQQQAIDIDRCDACCHLCSHDDAHDEHHSHTHQRKKLYRPVNPHDFSVEFIV